MKKVTKIVLTGGPCAGKTTALSWMQNAFDRLGYKVLFLPETATELINGGVGPASCRRNLDYQICQMRLQVQKERIFEYAAQAMPEEKILLVCDRGAPDNKAYMTQAEYAATLADIACSEVELRDGYDAVFHLVTAAKGAESFYTTANNTARSETPAEAAALDDALIAAWTGHPYLRILDNTTGFEAKLERLLHEIYTFLGESAPYENERKFLIARPDPAALTALPGCRRLDIIRTYLKTAPGEEASIRQRGVDGHYIYYLTTARQTAGGRVEVERRLTQDEYLQLLMEADTTLRQLRKSRYCFTDGSRCYDIDLYPFWPEQAIAQVGLSAGGTLLPFPQGLTVLREITGEAGYSNLALAQGRS